MADLTTIANVKAWVIPQGGGYAGADDPLLTGLITSLSAAIESWLNRKFLQATYSEIRNGTGHTEIMVRNDPIIAVASVTVGITAIPATPAIGQPNFGQAGYSFDNDTIYLNGYAFDEGVQNVLLQYTGGYPAIPVDVAEAATEAVSFLYRERDRIGLGSKAMAGETTAFLRDLPPHLIRRFQQYARVVTPS